MRDVEYLQVNGHLNFKALTERAREAMGRKIGGPWQMAAEIFFMHVPPEKFDSVVAGLHAQGLQTEPDAPGAVDVSQFTDF